MQRKEKELVEMEKFVWDEGDEGKENIFQLQDKLTIDYVF